MVRALVIEAKTPTVPSHAQEVAEMARNIGYQVLDTIIQQRQSLHHTYTIGPGKLDEVKQIVNEKQVEAILFANRLPGAQIFKIQKVLGGTDVKVIDRNLLILEVFDKRAMTKEAKLQIQLAKLRYTFSWGKEFLRLKGILGEQVGWSGPGNYPYHEYQRGARKQISRLERELENVYEKKKMTREHRRERGFPIIALAGYTQSGKTTFFNQVASEKKETGLGPFTTLTTFARKVELQDPTHSYGAILIDSLHRLHRRHAPHHREGLQHNPGRDIQRRPGTIIRRRQRGTRINLPKTIRLKRCSQTDCPRPPTHHLRQQNRPLLRGSTRRGEETHIKNLPNHSTSIPQRPERQQPRPGSPPSPRDPGQSVPARGQTSTL